ncbi:MAG: Mur ligase family protein [bacterium]
MLNKTLQRILKLLASRVVKRYQPEIIGVTGSVGKTSTKEAIACVLGSKYQIRQNKKNYNNEIGLPLTILGFDSPGSSIFKWLFLFIKTLGLIIKKDSKYPEIIILEMGIDRPGDMDYLISIARPQSGVVTTIGQSHLEFFGTQDKIAKEKGKLIERLSGQGWAVLNYDDLRVRRMKKISKSKVLTYGFDQDADISAVELVFSFENSREAGNLSGLSFKLKYQGSAMPVHLPAVIGYPAVYSALAAAAIGIAHGMNLVEISQALYNLEPPRGRMNIINGLKKSLIVDDTYNASPQSTLEAIRVTGMIALAEGARRWAILGDMFELGAYTEDGHLAVGQAVAQNNFDYLIAVGERSLKTIDGALKKKMKKDRIFHFSTALEVCEFIKQQLEPNDLLLIKGSQGMRMEKIVKQLVAEPDKVKELLVRQDWADA